MGFFTPFSFRGLTLIRPSAIATPFRYWQETGGYRDVLEMCDSVVGSKDTEEHKVLGTVPASVGNYAAYFRMNFRDSSKSPHPVHQTV